MTVTLQFRRGLQGVSIAFQISRDEHGSVEVGRRLSSLSRPARRAPALHDDLEGNHDATASFSFGDSQDDHGLLLAQDPRMPAGAGLLADVVRQRPPCDGETGRTSRR